MFDAPSLRKLELRFSSLMPAEVAACARWVEALEQRETISNPLAMLERSLQTRVEQQQAAAARATAPRPEPPTPQHGRSPAHGHDSAHADPAVAYRELEKIRALLDDPSASSAP